MTDRQRIRSFIDLKFCGTADKPVTWALIVSRCVAHLPGIRPAAVVLALSDEHPALFAAIVTAHGEFDPNRTGPYAG